MECFDFRFSPFYGITSGAEAAVHVARIYVHDLDENCILKIRNAFNMLRHAGCEGSCTWLLAFVHSAYSTSSSLWGGGGETIQSKEGVQQGDPLGPLLFCLTVHKLVS